MYHQELLPALTQACSLNAVSSIRYNDRILTRQDQYKSHHLRADLALQQRDSILYSRMQKSFPMMAPMHDQVCILKVGNWTRCKALLQNLQLPQQCTLHTLCSAWTGLPVADLSLQVEGYELSSNRPVQIRARHDDKTFEDREVVSEGGCGETAAGKIAQKRVVQEHQFHRCGCRKYRGM